MVAEEGVKLSERSEFLPPPRRCGLRGEPKAKLLGAFSLVRFFGARKEMNVKKISLFVRNYENCPLDDKDFFWRDVLPRVRTLIYTRPRQSVALRKRKIQFRDKLNMSDLVLTLICQN